MGQGQETRCDGDIARSIRIWAGSALEVIDRVLTVLASEGKEFLRHADGRTGRTVMYRAVVEQSRSWSADHPSPDARLSVQLDLLVARLGYWNLMFEDMAQPPDTASRYAQLLDDLKMFREDLRAKGSE